MTGEDCFSIWAPAGALWSAWAKPALFAQLPEGEYPAHLRSQSAQDVFWAPSPGRTAIVADLSGAQSIECGLALARRGYRPVPLYNTSFGPGAVVEVVPLVRELVLCAPALAGLQLRADAPPAFLLDANRMTPAVPPAPGKFDNRWIVFPQDLPSGSHLRARGIADVLLVHGDKGLQQDLAHVLLRWQLHGIRLQAIALPGGGLRELRVDPPSMFRRAWYRVITVAGLRRNNAGAFGGVIPVPSSGGHG